VGCGSKGEGEGERQEGEEGEEHCWMGEMGDELCSGVEVD
jgi:hypothetical protein